MLYEPDASSSNPQWSEPSLEQYSLCMIFFSKLVDLEDLYIFILMFEKTFYGYLFNITKIALKDSKSAEIVNI